MARRSGSGATGSPRCSTPMRCAESASLSKRGASCSLGTDYLATGETSSTLGAASSESASPADVASVASGALPALAESFLYAVDRVAQGQRNGSDLRHGPLVI